MYTIQYQKIKSESEVVVMLPFLQKSLIFNTIDLLDSKIKNYVSDRADVYMIHDPPPVMERGTKCNQPWVPTMLAKEKVKCRFFFFLEKQLLCTSSQQFTR